MLTSPISTWCCPTTPPVSTAARMTSPRKRRPHGKPPSAGTTRTQSSGLPKFGRSEQRQRLDDRYGSFLAVKMARSRRHVRFSDQSHLHRIREERVTPLVQGSHKVRLGVDCST